MSNRRIALIIGLAVLVAGGGVAGVMFARAGSTTAAPTTTTIPVEIAEDPVLEIIVDENLTPDEATVPGLEEGDQPRPVGRIVYEDGETADLVLGEVIVAVTDDQQLNGFLARHDGTVLDSFPGEDGELDEYLVSIPVTPVDPAEAADALQAVEEGHHGAYAVSDPYLLAMILVAATEKLDHDIDIALNWMAESAGITDGSVKEAPDRANPFSWSYLKIGGSVDTGVSGAWQLIDFYGKADTKVKIAIADGGFFENPDFPDDRKIRLESWNVKNPGKCSGGNDCPWHGTDVALAAMAKIDNGYGTAGVAGQVGSLIAVQAQGDFWTKLRKIKRVVDEERPAVVNMSFSWEVKTFRAASEYSTDRHLKAMKNDGALVFSSAGNDGKNVDQEICMGNHCYESRLTIPCESRYAVCVGGYDQSTAWLHGGSNYGPKGGGRSVQIYAPFCVITPFNPVNSGITDTKWTCGTSVSTPFMAGAAALVKAADPSLGPDQIWEVLRSTAHIGGLHFPHHIPTDNQVRVNVLDAVAKALGAEKTAPVVTITSPATGYEVSAADWYEVHGTAIDFKGQPLAITWESSVEGEIGTGFGSQSVFEPTAGTHTITARATDVLGQEGSASITIEVIDLPPVMSIAWPTPNSLFYETEKLTFVGLSLDPDTNSSLRDWDVEWEISRNGQVVHGVASHTAEIPGGILSPGTYKVVFRGYDSGGIGEAELEFKVLKVVGNLPTAKITTQFKEEPYGYGGGDGVKFTLTGVGTDIEDGVLPGTSFRWLAAADNGHVEVLCTGSTFKEPEEPKDFNPGLAPLPPVGPVLPPVFGVIQNCNNTVVELGLAPGAIGQTKWAIVLEVSDSDGQVGRDIADVHILFAVA